MKKSLNGGAIHVSIKSLEQGLEFCKLGKFNSLAMSPALVKDRRYDEVNELMLATGVASGAWGVSFNWRGSEAEHSEGLKKFAEDAEFMRKFGITRCATWILPGSNDMNFDQFGEFHIDRLTPVARILEDNGMMFGMEFIGPKTLRDSFRYPWVYTMGEMLKVGAEVGPNVGILLDIWHLITSGGSIDDVKKVDPKKIALVHINDAPLGVPVDELIDNKRGLPGSTGVLPLTELLRALRDIGYDGPVEAEPFDDSLKNLPSDEERVVLVGNSFPL